MNARPILAALSLALASCQPLSTVPPSALAVRLDGVDGPTAAPVITGTGGAVEILVSATSLPFRMCSRRDSVAEMVRSALVVTVTTTQIGTACPVSSMPALPNVRVHVDGMSSGAFDVVLVHRLVPMDDPASEQEVVRGWVVVP